MSVEILSSYAGIIEAIVVVVSLVYLAIQMRQNTLMTRAQASQALEDTYNSVYSAISLDGVVWRKGMKNMDDLNEDDKFKFIILCAQYSRAVETAYSQYRSGALDLDLWDGLDQTLRIVSNAKGYRQYWEIRSLFHGPAFRKLMEEDIFNGEETDEYINSLKGK
jgi:hypothetical protein